jgi:hypothetical protein
MNPSNADPLRFAMLPPYVEQARDDRRATDNLMFCYHEWAEDAASEANTSSANIGRVSFMVILSLYVTTSPPLRICSSFSDS